MILSFTQNIYGDVIDWPTYSLNVCSTNVLNDRSYAALIVTGAK